jgi:hypothetical protein
MVHSSLDLEIGYLTCSAVATCNGKGSRRVFHAGLHTTENMNLQGLTVVLKLQGRKERTRYRLSVEMGLTVCLSGDNIPSSLSAMLVVCVMVVCNILCVCECACPSQTQQTKRRAQ